MTDKKSVLLLSYLFPPIGGIGVQRPLKFARYLSDLDWAVTVLTVKDAYSATMDPSLLDEVPEDVPVVRVSDPAARWLKQAVVKTANVTNPGQQSSNLLKRKMRKFLKVCKDTLCIPDESVFWAIRAFWIGRKLVKQKSIDCLYTTSGPNSSHLAGLLIRWTTGVKWVADFRDPWTQNMHFHHRGLRRRIEQWIERKVFTNADTLITVTDGFKDLFISQYPECKDRIHVIRNGVDPHDFPTVKPVPVNPHKFTIFYSGILYPGRSPRIFLQALSYLIRNQSIRPDAISVQFAGVFDYPGYAENQNLVTQLGLMGIVELLGYISHQEALHRMQTSDALLLIGDDSRSASSYVPGKLYEYLYAEKPILALLKDGEAAGLIREANAGIIVNPADCVEVANAIRQLVYVCRSNNVQFYRTATIHKYTRQAQTMQLAELMVAMVGHEETVISEDDEGGDIPHDTLNSAMR